MADKADNARGRVKVEWGHKRVRLYLQNKLVADTLRPLLVWEVPYYPTYYVPAADVRADLKPTGEAEHSPSRGDALVHDVLVDGLTAAGKARTVPESPLAELRDTVRFDFDAFDWFEEDEPIYTHPRDPYSRIDVIASSRHFRAELDGVVLADSPNSMIAFETGLPPRYYVPITALNQDVLRPSETVTHCPYKGAATYWSVQIGDKVHKDLIWGYRTPFAEVQKIAGLAAVYNEKVDIYLDGRLQERPKARY
ncbi:MAG: DUF427 domain-containing protein [Catenulisporales bacterium]|jgi:uncharacterized protein (DUF427 family)|nr:DUF427 domain-containing protein [Catenulisporales bacterium]